MSIENWRKQRDKGPFWEKSALWHRLTKPGEGCESLQPQK